MQKYAAAQIPPGEPWSGPTVTQIGSAAVKLRWTDQPYRWHVNDGEEVFCVLDGVVDMHVRRDGAEEVIELRAGDVLHVGSGDEHVAHPRGPVRLLIVEQVGSA